MTHVGLMSQENILVDKSGTPHIAGLGNVHILPHSAALTAEDGADIGQPFRSHAGLAGPALSPKGTDATHPTKTGDMFVFGILAFEVRTPRIQPVQFAHPRQILTGRPPFSEMANFAATHSMLKGCRPPRPNHHDVSDQLWYMIERCWHVTPSQRMSIREAADLLEAAL